MIFECPGSGKFKRPTPESMICPYCKEEVEIWTDENVAKCPKCNNIVERQLGSSCLDWCKHARECVGDELYNKYLENKKTKGK